MNGEAIAGLDLDEDVKGGRRAAFEDSLLRTATAGFFVRKCHRFDAADEVAERGVEQKVIERLPMRRADQLHTAFCDGAGGKGFEFTPDLVDDDDFGVVILHGFDHHLVLKHRLADLHATRFAHSRVRHIAIAANFVRGVHDDHTLVLGEDAGGLTQKRGLAYTWATENEYRFTGFDQVLDDVHGAVDGATNAAG